MMDLEFGRLFFFKGYSLKCWRCHNPESQDLRLERAIKKYMLDEKSFTEQISVGKIVTVEEVMAKIEKELIFLMSLEAESLSPAAIH